LNSKIFKIFNKRIFSKFLKNFLRGINAIIRNEVLRRAAFWVGKVGYSQYNTAADPNGVRYHADCSGYVSMAWKLGKSLNTVTLPNVSRKYLKQNLKLEISYAVAGPEVEAITDMLLYLKNGPMSV
jgi:hypothetical protein